MATTDTAWIDHNQRFLAAAIAEVRACLERFANQRESRERNTAADSEPGVASNHSENLDPLPALELLVRSFGLSAFERAILVLCAGIELDSSLATLCAAAQASSARTYPTFSLGLAALPTRTGAR